MDSKQTFRGCLDEHEEEMLLAMQLSSLRIIPYVTKTVIELNLLEIIAKDESLGTHVSAVDLATNVAANNPEAPVMIDRLLRFLVSYSVCTCKLVKDEEGKEFRVYAIGKAGKKLIKDEDGFSMASNVLIQNPNFQDDMCSQLTASILEGGARAYERTHGTSMFGHMSKNESLQALFNEMMTNHTSFVMRKILKTYNGFESLSGGVLVDVGGGLGANLALILSKFPLLKGVNFDLPHVVSEAPKIRGVEHVGGDMFVEIPKGEAIFMKWILHDWSDEHCVKILKRCREALSKNGKIVLVESVGISYRTFPTELILPREISENDLATKVSLCFNVAMMYVTSGGKERTQEEFEILATEAGFKPPKITYGGYGFWILELYKEE